MPASMIREETGSPIWKVIGKSMAMVAVAPMPGSTPISVPSSTPIRQKPILAKVEAVAKPRARLPSRSIRSSSAQPGAEALEREAEPVAEHRRGEDGERDREGQRAQRRHPQRGEGREKRGDEDGADEAQPAHGQPEDDRGQRDEDDAAPGDGADRLAEL